MAARRMLKNWTTSDKIDTLSAEGERFFTRLIMVADDYGSYWASPALLKSATFPMKESIKAVKVAEWLDELITADIVFTYEVAGRKYLRIKDFDQRKQNMRNAFPQPVESKSPKVTVSHGESPPELEEEVEREKEEEVEHEHEAAAAEVWPRFEDWWDAYDKKISKPKCEKLWKKIPFAARAQIMAHTGEYVKATPELRYRKHPATYLNNESWNDEIIPQNGKSANNHIHPVTSSVADFAKRVSEKSAGKQIRPDPVPG